MYLCSEHLCILLLEPDSLIAKPQTKKHKLHPEGKQISFTPYSMNTILFIYFLNMNAIKKQKQTKNQKHTKSTCYSLTSCHIEFYREQINALPVKTEKIKLKFQPSWILNLSLSWLAASSCLSPWSQSSFTPKTGAWWHLKFPNNSQNSQWLSSLGGKLNK